MIRRIMLQPSHTIGRLVFDLEVDDPELERLIRREIQSWLNYGGSGEIDVLLNRFCPKGELLLLDRLEIGLGTLASDQVAGNIGEMMLKGLEDGLKKSFSDHQVTRLGPFDESMAIFMHYLEFGLAPWWARNESANELEARALTAASSNPQLFLKAILPLAGHPVALKRLTMQFSDRLSLELIKILFPSLLAELTYLNHILPELFHGAGNFAGLSPDELRQDSLELIWRTLLEGRKDQGPDLIVTSILRSFAGRSGLAPEALRQKLPGKLEALFREKGAIKEKRKQQSKSDREIHPERIYIDNAGLVLLWPFLPKLFTSLGLLEDGKFGSHHNQARALALTHYLVFGGQSFEESRMALNKILLGWPMEQPVGRMARLGKEEKKACLELLEEAIGQWKALKTTSVQGLRQGFLERRGVLHHEKDRWILNIERSGADVLLGRLPWPYQHIRLPWMEEPLIVT